VKKEKGEGKKEIGEKGGERGGEEYNRRNWI
jgi:hypothetical protein